MNPVVNEALSERGVHAASMLNVPAPSIAAACIRLTTRGHRAPSPLNGERAGVRGEAVRSTFPGSHGRASLEVKLVSGQSTVTSAFATSPMKLLTPQARGASVWACTSSFGGGLVAGDQTRLEVHVAPGARCYLGTQASTKIYRNPASLPSGHQTHATLDTGALLVFAPDPVQAFAGSSYTQRQEFHLAPDANLVLLDWFTSGRAARGERWAFSSFRSRNKVWRITDNEKSCCQSPPLTPALSPLRGEGVAPGPRQTPDPRRRVRASVGTEQSSVPEHGVQAASMTELHAASNAAKRDLSAPPAHRAPSPLNGERAGVRGEAFRVTPASTESRAANLELIFLDSVLLDGKHSPLDAPHRTGRFNCFATLLLLGPLVRDLAARLLTDVAARPVERRATIMCSASPLGEGALLRIAAEQAESVAHELHHRLAMLAPLLGDDPWARKW